LLELRLERNQLSGLLPPSFGQLTQLQGLMLDNNPLEGTVPQDWGSLTNLKIFSLYGTNVSGPLPAALEDVPASGYDRLRLGNR
jgi:Leucine-rich repeat (LRR) protein